MLSATTQKPLRERLEYLDSARGIAALMVLFGHFISFQREDLQQVKFAMFFFNGWDAVSFFFVLSGMVLSYPFLVIGRPLDLRKFIINRFFRLMPAFFAALVVYVLFYYKHNINAQTLLNVFVLNKQQFWEEALMLRTYSRYIFPAWTLSIELCLSMLVPFFIALQKQDKRLIYWLIAVLLIGGFIFDHFALHFLLGIIISANFRYFQSDNFRQTKWYKCRYAFLLLAMFLFSLRIFDKISPFGPTYNYWAGYFKIEFYHFSAVASFVFLIFIIQNSTLQKILSLGIFRFYGRIAYGIYIMHAFFFAVLLAYRPQYIISNSLNNIGLLKGLIFCLAGATISGYLLHILVEKPGMRWGKRFTSKLKPAVTI